jgi:flagellar basal-body rod protein FlgG
MSSEAILKFLEELGASLSATVGQLISAEVTYQAALAEASVTPTVWAAARLQEDDSCRLGVGVAEPAALEQSNVNVVDEFIQMILAQRGYEANSRVVRASDDMYSELNNMTH